MSRSDFYDQVERTIFQTMIAWLCAGQPLHVLDADCGTGAPALIFAEMGCTVIGVDVEVTVLDTARQMANRGHFARSTDVSGRQLTNAAIRGRTI